MPLALCVACRRHVRSSEARCPFCTAATITALVAGVALASCATDRGPANVYGGPPPEPKSDLMMIDAGSGGDDDASAPDASGAAARPDAGATTPDASATTPDAGPKATNPQRGGDVYGGPPPRR